MSKQLEAIENIASSERIRDLKLTDYIVKDLLDLPFGKLQGSGAYNLLVKDLSKGFDLDADKVSELKIRDVLLLIGYEPAFDYFAVPDGESWFYEFNSDLRFYSAWNCMLLAGCLNYGQRVVSEARQFMTVDYFTYMGYLREKILDPSDGRYGRPDKEKRARKVCGGIYKDTTKFVFSNNDSLDPVKGMTVGDVIETLWSKGTAGWYCGFMPIETFMDRTIQAHRLINLLFMDCTRMSLIMADRNDLISLLDSFGEQSKRESDIDEVVFVDCYE
ncbi:MAG: hypothetical protein K5888_09330 [Lachnospiraceae bacterium]|nr:hypothetical protein [Lachnospiraceae bacterium]